MLGNTDDVILGEPVGGTTQARFAPRKPACHGRSSSLRAASGTDARIRHAAAAHLDRRRRHPADAGGHELFLWRVVQRDLAIARLQTEFVSAVSHEFRTPLSSLRHVSELLDENDDVPAERRQALYAALSRNTARLQQLVESLLDFARMEGRRKLATSSLSTRAS